MVTVRYLDPRESAFQHLVRQAVRQAVDGAWEAAAATNAKAAALAPHDADSQNRLGKALMEIGRYEDAGAAFRRASELRPGDAIARKNLQRLEQLGEAILRPTTIGNVPRPKRSLFITDRSRAVMAELRPEATGAALSAVSPGDALDLIVRDGAVAVTGPDAQRLGALDGRLGARLARLISGGNVYEATAAHVSGGSLTVLLREVSRSPGQRHIVSFPPASSDGRRGFSDFDEPIPSLLDEVFDEPMADEDEPDDPRRERIRALIGGAPVGVESGFDRNDLEE